jgi:hypothetical protein
VAGPTTLIVAGLLVGFGIGRQLGNALAGPMIAYVSDGHIASLALLQNPLQKASYWPSVPGSMI